MDGDHGNPIPAEKRDAAAPRRRRAVRDVQIGNTGQNGNTERTADADVKPGAAPAAARPRSVSETQAKASAPAAEAVPAETVRSDARQNHTVQNHTVHADVPHSDVMHADAVRTEPRDAVGSEMMPDAFSVRKQEHETVSEPDDGDFGPLSAKPRADRSGVRNAWILSAILLCAVLAVCGYRYLTGRTEAVMVYYDGAAVGYIASEQTEWAELEYRAVLDTLARDGKIDADGTLELGEVTRTEARALLSEGALYDALLAAAADGYVRGYLIYGASGELLASVQSEAEILAAEETALAVLTQALSDNGNLPADAEVTVTRAFTYAPAWVDESGITEGGALTAAMCTSDLSDNAFFTFTAVLHETVTEILPYETDYIANDEAFDGVTTMISAGLDGLAQVTYTVILDAETGAELSKTESGRVIVREPVNAVSYEGVYPLPDGVSTGTFDWPLPELPDDEMPLDENGSPYMPENPLALKNTYISSGYGERTLWGAYDFHLGIDIVAPVYTEIYACDGGVVVYAAYTSSYGYMTRIRHADGLETVYAHQAKQAVKAGDVVSKGQLIGYVGATGSASGCHLHLEIRYCHVCVDPLTYIKIPEDVYVLGE